MIWKGTSPVNWKHAVGLARFRMTRFVWREMALEEDTAMVLYKGRAPGPSSVTKINWDELISIANWVLRRKN